MKLLPNMNLAWPIAWAGVMLIAQRESCSLVAYRCPAGRWTCGWGETDGVGPSTRWTQEYADQRFCDSLTQRAEAVRALCTLEPTAEQLAAMVSLSYNIGTGAFAKSTVRKRHNAGEPEAAARAFGLWNKARNPQTGKLEVLPGLTSRRLAEAALYLSPQGAVQAMPQAVAPESRPVVGPIAGGGLVTIGTGVLAGLREAGDGITGIKPALDGAKGVLVDTLGIPPSWILPIVLIVAGALVVRYRLKQRRDGWA